MASAVITWPAIKGDGGDSLMGVNCAISRIEKEERLVSHMGIKSRILSDTHTVHNSPHFAEFSYKKKNMASASWLKSGTCSEMCLTHPPTHLVSSDLRPQALVKVYKELWGVSG